MEQTKSQAGSYNTTDLASDLSKKFGMTKAQALKVIAAFGILVGNAISRGDIVRIHQFGNFKRLVTKARKGRNPRTGEETTIEASARPHFVAAQALKNKIKEGTVELLDDIQVNAPAAPAAKAPAKSAAKAPTKKQPVQRIPVTKQAPAPVPLEEAAPAGGSAIDEL
jgi:nucleoid DNA-binding protein